MTARRAGRALLALLVAAVVLGVGARPAAADSVTIREVDTTAFPNVRLTVVVHGQKPSEASFNVGERGQYVQPLTTVAVGPSTQPSGTVLVVDTSAAMGVGDRLGQVRAAIGRVLDAKRPADRVALVAAGADGRVLVPLTTDAGPVRRALAALQPSGTAALADATRLGANLFDPATDPSTASLQANVLVLAGSRDTGSTLRWSDARAAATGNKALVFAVATAPGVDRGDLQSLAAATGGTYAETADPAAIGTLVSGAVGSLGNEYTISYTSQTPASTPFDVTVQVGSLTATAPAVTAAQRTRGQQVTPETFSPRASIGPLRDERGVWIVVAIAALAVMGLAWAVLALVVQPSGGLEERLAAYEVHRPGSEDDDELVGRGALAQSAVIKRAVKITEDLARERGILGRLEKRLEQADIKLRAPELLFFDAAGVVLFGVLVAALTGSPAAFLIAVLLGVLGPPALLNFLAGRRQRKFVALLPDTLNLLAGTLRAGYSLLQGVDAVVKEVDEPMAKELSRVLVEAQLGRELEDALTDCAARMESPDFEWAVMAINIQREVGGNLAELLDTVADTMVERERLRRDVQALTAEGRVSAYVLTLLPVGLAVAMAVINPDYIGKLITTGIGNALLGASVVAAIGGYLWMRKIITIDV